MSGEAVVTGVGTIIDVSKAGLSLFTEWPLNIMVLAGILGIGIGIVRGFIPKRRR